MRARVRSTIAASVAILLLCLNPVPSSADDEAATRLAALLGRRSAEALDARFRQTKHIALLQEPLVSTGRVRFELPDGLRWEVIEPEPLVVDTRGGRLRTGPPGELREVPTSALGPFAALPGGFSGVFGATSEEITAAFEVSGSSSPGSFRLTPKDRRLARALEAIDLVLAPETGVPRRVVLHEAGGDRSEIEIESEPHPHPSVTP